MTGIEVSKSGQRFCALHGAAERPEWMLFMGMALYGHGSASSE